MTNTFNAIWETGAAAGNTFLIGNSGPAVYPSGYPAGQSYGLISVNNWACCSWYSGSVISVSQAGNTLMISALNPNGSVAASQPLSYVSAGVNTTSVSTTSMQPGIYKDTSGNQYLVSGPTLSPAGREQWTISSTTSPPGTINTFNAVWETGAAVGNTFLIGNSGLAVYPSGYPATRLYGITSSNNWSCCSWNNGHVVSLSQAGSILMMSSLNVDGSVATSQMLSYVSASVNTTSVSTTSMQPGIYKDTSGNQYLVSGPTLSPAGREQWTISSTTSPPGTINTFNAVWETGAAVGNTFLIGNSGLAVYPSGYPATRLYGITSSNNWSCCSWNNGHVVSLSQAGSILMMSSLNVDGSVATSQMLSYVSASVNTTSVSTTSMQPGIYKDTSGNQYLVSGPTLSPAGREQWTISSTTSPPGTINTFNAVWETGAAVGNTFLIGNSGLAVYPSGYPATRLYGITSSNNWSCCSWNNGHVVSLSQAGSILMMSSLNVDGSVATSQMLSYVSASVNTTSVSTTSMQPGIYKDTSGNQYLVSGPTLSPAGREQWTISSTTSPPGTINTFNAVWETGAAVGNTFLIGNSGLAVYPSGYPATRVYGITSSNNWSCCSWNNGHVVSLSQAGSILMMSSLNVDGSVATSQMLSYVSAGGMACAIGTLPGTLSGNVRDALTSAATAGVAVQLNGAAVLTNSLGQYSFANLAPGYYTMSVVVSGYTAYRLEINVCGNLAWDISLTKNATTQGLASLSGYSADPVNTATGNYVYQHRDIQFPGKGMPFVFERSYNSQAGSDAAATSGQLGFGWTHNYNTSLSVDAGGNVTVNWGDGKTETYANKGAGTYTPQYGVFDTLTANAGGTYTLKKKNLTSYNFDATYHLASIVDKNGNTLTFTYTSAHLTQATDTAGRNIAFTYDASNRIITITDPLARTVQFTYDAGGNLATAQDTNGNITHYSYDGSHQLTVLTDPRGNAVVTNVYDASNRVVISQRDAKNGQTTYVYDPTNHKTTLTDAMNNVTVDYHDALLRLVRQVDARDHSTYYHYDAAGNRDQVTDKNGNLTTYSYDTSGNVTGKTDALGHASAITYDANNNPLTRTDALNNTTTFTYDTKGNLLTVKDALNNTATNTYNAAGQVLTTTDALNNTTTNTYDLQGNLIQVTDALNNSTVSTYDGAGRKLTRKDALNRTTSYAYDNNDNLLSSTDPNLKSATATYDGNNNRLTASDKRGNVTRFAYDVKDLLTTTTDPLTKTVVNTYDALDRKTAVKDKNNNTAQFAYDGTGNLINATDALNHVTSYTYDANGNRLSATDPLLHATRYTYDALNRQATAVDALTNQTTTTYDALGRVVASTNAKNQTTSFAYDKLGHLILVTDAKGGTVKYSYDANGNRLTMTDPNNHVTSYTYDVLNRVITKTEPLLGVTQYQYDVVGNRTQVTQPNGTIIRYAYDNLDRLQTITYPNATSMTFTYDFDGNRTGMVDALGTSSAVYDVLGRMTSYTDAYGQTVSYGYDANGNRLALTYPGAKTVSYAYDALNRMASVTDWLTHQTTYTYDAAGRLTGSNDPNSVATAYGFDNASRLTSLSHAQGATPIASYAFTLDAIGNHAQVTQTEPLPSVVTSGTANYTYDVDNRLTAINGVANTFDLNGNMTAKGTNAYTYDFEDRLKQTTIGSAISQYQYDGLGHRYAKIGVATTRYVLDLNGTLSKVLMETDATNTVSAYYVYGLGLISRISAAGAASYYHFDTRGSTIALTDAAGTVTDKYAYDPFGNLSNSQGATPNPFKYVGQYGVMDEGNGLYYIRARYYDAQLGRFINKDPKMGNDQDGQSLNRYAYAQNNPVMMVDPSGFFSWSTLGVGLLQQVAPVGSIAGWAASVISDVLIPPKIFLDVATVPNTFNDMSKQTLASWTNIFGAFNDHTAVFAEDFAGKGIEDQTLYKVPGVERLVNSAVLVDNLIGINDFANSKSLKKGVQGVYDALSTTQKLFETPALITKLVPEINEAKGYQLKACKK